MHCDLWFPRSAWVKPHNSLNWQGLWSLFYRWGNRGSERLKTFPVHAVGKWQAWNWNQSNCDIPSLLAPPEVRQALWQGLQSVTSRYLLCVWCWDWDHWPHRRTSQLSWLCSNQCSSTFICFIQRALAWNFDKKILLLNVWRPQLHKKSESLSYEIQILVCVRICLICKKLGTILLLSLLQRTHPKNILYWPYSKWPAGSGLTAASESQVFSFAQTGIHYVLLFSFPQFSHLILLCSTNLRII